MILARENFVSWASGEAAIIDTTANHEERKALRVGIDIFTSGTLG